MTCVVFDEAKEEKMDGYDFRGRLQALAAIERVCGKDRYEWPEYLSPVFTDGTKSYNAGHTVNDGELVQYDVYICPGNVIYLNITVFEKGGAFLRQETTKYTWNKWEA